MAAPVLYALPYSPWSRKAMWALAAHGITADVRPYKPLIGELGLRMRSGAFFEKPSVPQLVTDDGPLGSSWAIAAWSATQVDGGGLIPDASRDAIAAWDERSDALMQAGRARIVFALLDDPAALRENVPPPLHRLGPVTTALGALGTRFVASKYGASDTDRAAHNATLAEGLRELRTALNGRDTLLDRFTYADVAMSLVLQFVAPAADEYIRLGPASRAAWADPELATEFADLVEWRNRVFAEHWPAPTA